MRSRDGLKGMTNEGMVRCLGPGDEHQFWSADTVRLRVCRQCTELLEKLGPTARPIVLPRQRPRPTAL
jgi:hypothetical protein